MADAPTASSPTTYLDLVVQFYTLIASNPWGQTLLFVGVVLILVAARLAYRLIKADPTTLTRWLTYLILF